MLEKIGKTSKKKCNIIACVYVKFHIASSIPTVLLSCTKPNDLKTELWYNLNSPYFSEQVTSSMEKKKKKKIKSSLTYWPEDSVLAILLQLKYISFM